MTITRYKLGKEHVGMQFYNDTEFVTYADHCREMEECRWAMETYIGQFADLEKAKQWPSVQRALAWLAAHPAQAKEGRDER